MDIISEKVKELIENEKFPEIKDDYKKAVTEKVLSQQIKFLQEAGTDNPSNSATSGVANWNPVLVRMVRRATPQLMAFDLAGVQPMSGPTGIVFAMRSRYTSQTGTEALYNEPDSAFSGTGTQAGDTSGFAADAFSTGDPATSTSFGTGMSLATAEALGTTAGGTWAEMTFSIESTSVTAVSRKLKASFTRELQHDLKQMHGMDAQTELANILSTEIVAEQDRELLRTINISAALGATTTTVPHLFNLAADSDGRWLVERFKGLLFQLEIEANQIMYTTRRGKANVVICSANVASALNMAGVLDYAPAIVANLNVDITQTTFAGVLMGRYKVYVDPYTSRDYITLGYKGANAWDAGVYWCPYVPLEMVTSVAQESFQPRIGFQTRYGVIANPYSSTLANGTTKTGKGLGQGENDYFRKFAVSNITG